MLLDENEMAEIKAAKLEEKAQKKAQNALKRVEKLSIVQQKDGSWKSEIEEKAPKKKAAAKKGEKKPATAPAKTGGKKKGKKGKKEEEEEFVMDLNFGWLYVNIHKFKIL